MTPAYGSQIHATDAFVRAPGAPPWVYGHRGMRGAPENTLPAFERALEVGADGVELDVRLCKSGEVVVMHDVDLQRMAARADRIAELDYATLRGIDLGAGATTPLLRDVLELVLRRGKRVNVEIKADVPDLRALALATAQELLARSKAERALVLVSSFEAGALRMLQEAAPGVAVGFLFANAEQEANAPELRNYGEHPRFSYVTKQSLQGFAERAGFVNVWTVNDAAEARRLSALGVDGIISDVPDLIRAAL